MFSDGRTVVRRTAKPLFNSINAAVESLSTQEPVREDRGSTLNAAPFMTCWKVFPGHFDQERFTFPLRVTLLGGTKPNASAIGNTLGAVPIVVDNDGEETYVFEVEAFLHIGNTYSLREHSDRSTPFIRRMGL